MNVFILLSDPQTFLDSNVPFGFGIDENALDAFSLAFRHYVQTKATCHTSTTQERLVFPVLLG